MISYYSGRGKDGTDEALCDAGAIALSKDTGPSGSYGEVIGTTWKLGRISQEHGILRWMGPAEEEVPLTPGQRVRIWPNHSCITGAGHPYYLVVDSRNAGREDEIVDVWVRWNGW